MKRHAVDDIEHELERAIFNSLYGSFRQRFLRFFGVSLIAGKHGLRGLLYVWPLALLIFIDLPGYWAWLKLVLLLLATAAWFRFVFGSVRDDYKRFIQNRILEWDKIYRVL